LGPILYYNLDYNVQVVRHAIVSMDLGGVSVKRKSRSCQRAFVGVGFLLAARRRNDGGTFLARPGSILGTPQRPFLWYTRYTGIGALGKGIGLAWEGEGTGICHRECPV
jgi:hypothetical protein